MSNSRRFIGKVAFVTGAASGIGRATAVALLPRARASRSSTVPRMLCTRPPMRSGARAATTSGYAASRVRSTVTVFRRRSDLRRAAGTCW